MFPQLDQQDKMFSEKQKALQLLVNFLEENTEDDFELKLKMQEEILKNEKDLFPENWIKLIRSPEENLLKIKQLKDNLNERLSQV